MCRRGGKHHRARSSNFPRDVFADCPLCSGPLAHRTFLADSPEGSLERDEPVRAILSAQYRAVLSAPGKRIIAASAGPPYLKTIACASAPQHTGYRTHELLDDYESVASLLPFSPVTLPKGGANRTPRALPLYAAGCLLGGLRRGRSLQDCRQLLLLVWRSPRMKTVCHMTGSSSHPASESLPVCSETEPDADPRPLISTQLGKMTERITEPQSVLRVLQDMLRLTATAMGATRAWIVLADAGRSVGRVRYSYGLTAQEAARGIYEYGEGISGQVLRDGCPITIPDIDSEPAYLGRVVQRGKLPEEATAFMASPMEMEGMTVGVRACHKLRQNSEPSFDDEKWLGAMATLAVQLLRLDQSVTERLRFFESKNADLVRGLEFAVRYGIIGRSPRMLRGIYELKKASDTTTSILLSGDSGTGKGLFARALDFASPRSSKTFVKVNCVAVPPSLFDAELFGYEAGVVRSAFTSHAGWFEQANEGTIFLDEISELPLSTQARVLHILRKGAVTRLGGNVAINVNVRGVTSTNRDLEAEVCRGSFRADLFRHLTKGSIRLPFLANRRDDIKDLAMHFIRKASQANHRDVALTSEAFACLEAYSWPGNVRELENFMEQIVLLSEKPLLDAVDLEAFMPPHGRSEPFDCADARRATRKSADGAPRGRGNNVGRVATAAPARPYTIVSPHEAKVLVEALEHSVGD